MISIKNLVSHSIKLAKSLYAIDLWLSPENRRIEPIGYVFFLSDKNTFFLE